MNVLLFPGRLHLTIHNDGRSLSEAAFVHSEHVPGGQLLLTLGSGGKGRRETGSHAPRSTERGAYSLVGGREWEQRRLFTGAHGMPTWPEASS